MGVAEWVAIAVFILGAIFARYTYLLDKKDKSQEEEYRGQGTRHDAEIKELLTKQDEVNKLLFKLHQDDSALLTEVRLDLAKNFHPKDEIKNLFDSFKMHVDSRFDRLERHIGMDRRGTRDQ